MSSSDPVTRSRLRLADFLVQSLADTPTEECVTGLFADALGIADGEYARVTSERGSIVVKATHTDRVDEGSVFVPMHFLNGRVNQLTENELDPTSYIPGYKVTSVDVTPLGPDPDAEPLAAPPTDD